MNPIDAVWSTQDVEVLNACAMPICYGVGDHCAFIIDFRTASLVGVAPQPICRPLARRLNTKIPACADNCNQTLKSLISRHRLIDKLAATHISYYSPAQLRISLDAIDLTASQCMKHAERRCHKIISGRIPFSPEASHWIK
jgi:hypothetical protein